VDKEEAESGSFDRIVVNNATAKQLSLPATLCIDLATLS
jgi:hypothetical protein